MTNQKNYLIESVDRWQIVVKLYLTNDEFLVINITDKFAFSNNSLCLNIAVAKNLIEHSVSGLMFNPFVV